MTRGNVGLAEINGDRRADYLVHDGLGGVKAWFNNGAGPGGGDRTTTPMRNDPPTTPTRRPAALRGQPVLTT